MPDTLTVTTSTLLRLVRWRQSVCTPTLRIASTIRRDSICCIPPKEILLVSWVTLLRVSWCARWSGHFAGQPRFHRKELRLQNGLQAQGGPTTGLSGKRD